MDEDIHSEKEFLDLVEKYTLGLLSGEDRIVCESITNLRKMVRDISILDASQEWRSSNSIFLLYFLDKFIRDMWIHFGADAPFEDITNVQIDISKKLGKTLEILLNAVRERSSDEPYVSLNFLINYYLDQLTYIEQKLQKKYI
jgi:hypothetical protein